MVKVMFPNVTRPSEITLLWARGIGEQAGSGMRDEVSKHLPKSVRLVEVPWLASYGPVGSAGLGGPAYEVALERGRLQMLSMIDATSSKVILGGYSGGASLAGNVAAEISSGMHSCRNVLGVLLVADPHMPRGVEPGLFGVAGARPIGGLPVSWAVSSRDPIPCTPELSPLRTLADQSAAMSLVDPVAWGSDLLDRLRRQRWQPSAWQWDHVPGSLQRIGEAIGAAIRYGLFHYADYPGTRVEAAVSRLCADLGVKS